MTDPQVHTFLNLLRRVPNDIILAVASRNVELGDADRCICGWVLREDIAREIQADAADAKVTQAMPKGWSVVPACVERFGGEEREWESFFYGVTETRAAKGEDYAQPFYETDTGEATELAFLLRVDEAVCPVDTRSTNKEV